MTTAPSERNKNYLPQVPQRINYCDCTSSRRSSAHCHLPPLAHRLMAQLSLKTLGCDDAVSEVRRRVGDEARHVRVEVWAQDLALIASDGVLGKLGGPPARTLDAVARRVREGAAAGAGLGVCGGVRASGC